LGVFKKHLAKHHRTPRTITPPAQVAVMALDDFLPVGLFKRCQRLRLFSWNRKRAVFYARLGDVWSQSTLDALVDAKARNPQLAAWLTHALAPIGASTRRVEPLMFSTLQEKYTSPKPTELVGYAMPRVDVCLLLGVNQAANRAAAFKIIAGNLVSRQPWQRLITRFALLAAFLVLSSLALLGLLHHGLLQRLAFLPAFTQGATSDFMHTLAWGLHAHTGELLGGWALLGLLLWGWLVGCRAQVRWRFGHWPLLNAGRQHQLVQLLFALQALLQMGEPLIEALQLIACHHPSKNVALQAHFVQKALQVARPPSFLEALYVRRFLTRPVIVCLAQHEHDHTPAQQIADLLDLHRPLLMRHFKRALLLALLVGLAPIFATLLLWGATWATLPAAPANPASFHSKP
jgi:hypothetical protein